MSKPKIKRLPVCINVFATLDYIEMVQLNEETRDIQVTAAVPCSFDPATRQMQDMELFVHSIRDLYVTNRIPFSTPVVLVLPSVLTREFDVPPELSKEELQMMATSEAERFNIFKNLETHLDLLKISPGQYVYSAYPKQEIDKFISAFADLKISVAAIEINYFSILRGLLATGTIADEVATGEAWGMMVVSDSAFFIGIFQGIQLLTISETLLSQNIDTPELLQELRDDFESFTKHQTFSKMVLINNNLKLNTDDMLGSLNLSVPVATIDQKPGNLASRGALEASLPCTLEAIGGVFFQEIKELPAFDLRLKNGGEIQGLDELKARALFFSIIACAAAFGFCLLLWGMLALMIHSKTSEIQQIATAQTNGLSSETLRQYDNIQQKLFVKKAYNQNVLVNNAVVEINRSINANIWLNKLQVTNLLSETAVMESIPLTIQVDGRALSTDQVSELTNQLKKNLNRDDLTVPTIESEKVADQTVWRWSIASPPAQPAAAPGTPSPPPPTSP